MNFQKIFYWALVLFSIYLAMEIIRRVLGGSWGYEELIVGLVITNIGLTFQINSKLSEHLGCTEMH